MFKSIRSWSMMMGNNCLDGPIYLSISGPINHVHDELTIWQSSNKSMMNKRNTYYFSIEIWGIQKQNGFQIHKNMFKLNGKQCPNTVYTVSTCFITYLNFFEYICTHTHTLLIQRVRNIEPLVNTWPTDLVRISVLLTM